ncbi:MAG TPA: APC family permease [Tepidisphaeraceae bacterium]|jgi:amino acid transporter|nr:APC family permease [Tepidisphaeraceae bacterium]
MHDSDQDGKAMPKALAMLASERPRNVGWFGAAALLFGDWGTSRLYVLGLAFLVAGVSSFWLIAGMSMLILAVSWAYTQICRIYPDGGGVYTAARQRSRLLAVIGALLLFADYTVTASMSAVDAFHYFGLGDTPQTLQSQNTPPGGDIRLPNDTPEPAAETKSAPATEAYQPPPLLSFHSPGLWAIIAIVGIGAFNLLGPKHSAGFALFAAAGMVVITLLVVCVALPNVDWHHLDLGTIHQPPVKMWHAFVFVVLALSGVEAIANLTGVMHKPVYATARKSIWVVAAEVAFFNLLLALIMVSMAPDRQSHVGDMMAYIAEGANNSRPWLGWPVRIIGGLLLLSACNTAVNGLMSIMYVMSRDSEMPALFQKLNGFGAPWVGAVVAAGTPALVLIFAHDLETLASLYAIGVVGAVAINCCLCTFHPRLRKLWRKIPMAILGTLLIAIWITLAFTKWHALVFVCIVLAIGLTLRQITKTFAKRHPKPSLLRQAIVEQLTPEAFGKPKLLLATAGSDAMAIPALAECKQCNSALVVAFIREVSLSYKVEAETRLTLETDPAAQALFAAFLAHGHRLNIPIIPVYDTGPDSTLLIAETAAIYGCEKVLIGSSRRGAVYHMIKGSFQKKLEHLLPPEIPVKVLTMHEPAP